MKKKVLVVDIGGTNVKLLMSPRDQRKFASGPKMGPKEMVGNIKETVHGWRFAAISIGKGWVGFDFAKAFRKPVHVINDAAMQALGSYHGGRMLFLGLGTGLGSALVWEKTLLPLELGDLPYRHHEIIEEWLGEPGLDRLGQDWMREVEYAITQLKRSFVADHVVLGGGNVRFFDALPEGFERGDNRNAFRGGARLWEIDPSTRRKKWRVM